MKLYVLAAGVLCLLTSCADVSSTQGVPKKDSPHADAIGQADAVYRNPNRANLEFTYDMMVYADKIEFTDSTHSTCHATGHVWLKCSHPIEGLEELFGDKAEINMFGQILRMEGNAKALMSTKDSAQKKQIIATSGATHFEVDRGEGGVFFKVNGPSRTDIIGPPAAAAGEPEKNR